MTSRTDKAIASAFRIALDSGFGWRSISYIKNEWFRVSPERKQYVISKLEEKLPEFEQICIEAGLYQLFGDKSLPLVLFLDEKNAKAWIEFYNWAINRDYQDPPDTKSSNSHLPVV